jgi:hypothetical protein
MILIIDNIRLCLYLIVDVAMEFDILNSISILVVLKYETSRLTKFTLSAVRPGAYLARF